MPLTLPAALAELAAECPWKMGEDVHREGKQRHVRLAGGPVTCHSASFVRALPDSGWRRSDAQAAYETVLDREFRP